MPQAQYLKGTEDRKTSVFLPDLPWYLPVGADGRLAELQAEAFHGAAPVPPRLPSAFRPGIQTPPLSPANILFHFFLPNAHDNGSGPAHED